jgi:hypothetical protein
LPCSPYRSLRSQVGFWSPGFRKPGHPYGILYHYQKENTGSPRFLYNPLDSMPWPVTPVEYPPSRRLTMDSFLSSTFLTRRLAPQHKHFRSCFTFTLSDYGLLPPCLRFTYTVTPIDAKLGSGGRLTLPDWLFNQLDYHRLAPGALRICFSCEKI